MKPNERRKYSRRVEQINRRFERVYFDPVRRALNSKVSSLISDIRNNGVNAARNELAKDIANPRLSRVIEAMYKTVGLKHANRVMTELRASETVLSRPKKAVSLYDRVVKVDSQMMQRKGFGFNAEWTNIILDYLNKHLIEKITFGVNQTLRDHLLKVISNAIAEGVPMNEILKQLSEDNFTRSQAARIVRTEINAAANVGAMAAGKTYEFETQKEWIAAMDARTRGTDPEDHASHRKLDGTVVDYEEPFIDPRNGDKLMQPGDPNASAESIINCRCTSALIGKRDESGRLIRKRKV